MADVAFLTGSLTALLFSLGLSVAALLAGDLERERREVLAGEGESAVTMKSFAPFVFGPTSAP